jgi:hypothetical protein
VFAVGCAVLTILFPPSAKAISLLEDFESNTEEEYEDSKEKLLKRGVIVVRVDKLKFEDVISGIRGLGLLVEESVKSDDVTDQYTDTESRLRNLKAQEEQLILIMKKAATVEETLKIQNELYRIRGEIEVLEGRIKMWDKLVEFSTITVTLNRVKEIGEKEVKVSIISWDEIIKGMSNGFKSVLNVIIRFFSGVLIVIVSILPLIPFAALAVWLILRYRKKSRRNINQ